MYTVYIPKFCGDKSEYKITEIIRLYTQKINSRCNFLISSPGYLSSSINGIYNFVNEFQDHTLAVKKEVYVGIFNGINGNNNILYHPVRIIDEYKNQINGLSYLKWFPIDCVAKADHRKMMFFIFANDINHIIKNCSPLSCSNYIDFLKNIDVYAVMIGSSNQSYNTYYNSPTNKGESDVFMFSEDALTSNNMESIINQNLLEGVILSKSLIVPKNDDKEFLKEILKNFLKNSLN